MWNNLRFFNGTDYEIQLVQDTDGIWTGKVYMPEVSTNLYETVNLFVLEDCLLNGDPVINKPVSPDGQITTLDFSWTALESDQSKDVIMYDMRMDGGKAYVRELKTQTQTLAPFTTIDSQDANNLKSINTNLNSALQINIAVSSENEGIHKRVLQIKAGATVIANIEFYCEVEAEDERLKILLGNLGAALDEEDFMLFKSHDISEMHPDYKLLNQKRRELLLELNNIKPFVGTYKAILNAIDFFGYDKITLKEYWINVDKDSKTFGKLHAIPVPNSSVRGEMTRKLLKFKMPSATQKKTSRFSLVYRLNEPNGTFDQWDFANVDEVFDYTPDEVLIKLYGLKNRLQRDFLPLEAKIVDITGEGDYFSNKNLNIWKIQNPIGFFTEGHKVKFDVFPKDRDLFIEDTSMVLKPSLDQDSLSNNYNAFLNLGIGDESNLTEAQRTELKAVYEKFYETYHDREMNSWNSNFSSTTIPIGCPVILDSMESWDDVWDEAKFVWNDAVDANENLKVTWNNWWKRWVYEVEWIIDGPNGWHKEYRGPVDDYKRLPVSLPYVGAYTIELRFYDLFGHMSYYKKDDLFEVKLKELELYGIYKWLEVDKKGNTSAWDSKFLDWDKSGGYWDFAQDNTAKIDDNIATFYQTLDRANYLHREEDQGVRFSMVRRYVDAFSDTGYSETTGPYQWDECSFGWKDAVHNWWDNMRVGPDLTASFKIDWIEQGDTLKITHRNPSTKEIITGEHIITTGTPNGSNDVSGWEAIANELEASTDPIISKFNYNPVFFDVDNDDDIDNVDLFYFILCSGQEYSKNYDFENVEIIKGANSILNEQPDGFIHSVAYNPSWDNLKVFKNWAEVEKSTHVTISTDISKFPGARNPKWTITNITNPEINDIYYNNMWLTYIFQEPGNYSIELEAEDTYGNKNVVKRNMLKVK
jgi:PKD repeat protein